MSQTTMSDTPLYPVQFVDSENSRLTLGWVAMPIVPSVDDGVQLPGMRNARVTSRRWEFMKPGETFSMRDAGIDPQWSQWVAIVALGDFEGEEGDG